MEIIIISAVIIGGIGPVDWSAAGDLQERNSAAEVDEREVAVRMRLSRENNCGGCGYPGCDGLAAAIVKGEAAVNACPVGGAEAAAVIGKVMGQGSLRNYETGCGLCAAAEAVPRPRTNMSITAWEDCNMMIYVPNGGAKICNEDVPAWEAA